MAKPKTRPANAWLTIPSSWGLPGFLLAPAEAAVRWRGRDGDKVRITFHNWKAIFDKLPDELKPTRGHPQTPHVTLASESEAKAAIAKLFDVVQSQHPDKTVKKKKNGTYLRFMTGESREDPSYNVVVTPESAGDVAWETTGYDVTAWSWPVDGVEVLLWRARGSHDVKVRATAGEIVFLHHAASVKDPDQLAASLTGEATTHGTWSFNKLLVGMWISLAVKDLKGLEGTDVAALAACTNTVIKAKKSEEGGAVVLPATGRYRAESGGTDDVSWLRFVRP